MPCASADGRPLLANTGADERTAAMSLFTELKRRNVFRAAAAYLALGWVVTQVTATVGPVMHLPEWALPLVVWVGVIGFPFVLIFSWVFELTPEGLKRERDVDRSSSVAHVTATRLDYLAIGLFCVAIVLFFVDRFAPRSAAPAPTPAVAAGDAASPATPGSNPRRRRTRASPSPCSRSPTSARPTTRNTSPTAWPRNCSTRSRRSRTQGRRPHLVVLVQGQERGPAADRADARGRERARRLGAQAGRQGPHHGAADPGPATAITCGRRLSTAT
jgi:hypothetical protein